MENESRALTVVQPKTMMIKNLCPGLQEVGKIKIGNKGAKRSSQGGSDWQPPQKLDYFLLTTLERGADNNYVLDKRLHQKFGEKPKEIPVRLIYDDIGLNFATRYICYYGKTVFCSGDGETAQRLQSDKTTYKERTCPCERQDPKFAGDVVNGQVKAGQGKCKINGILSVIVDGADSVGGVWKFRTTSYNTVVGIMSSLALISRITGGRLAGIPLNMTVSPKTTQDPIKGGQVTVYVVGLTFAGNMDTLRNTGYQIAMDEAKHGISMKDIENRAMVLLSHTPSGGGIGDDDTLDVLDEFYPEEAQLVHSGQQTSFVEVQTQQQVQQQETQLFDGVKDQQDQSGQQQNQQEAGKVAEILPARERGKPSPGKARRNAAEVAEDKAADERDAAAIETANQAATNEAVTAACEHPDEALFTEGGVLMCGQCGNPVPDEAEPVSVQTEQVQPAAQVQETKPAAQQAGAAMPDLF